MSIVNTVLLKSNRQIKINFNGGDLSSDAGLLLIKEFAAKIGFDKLIKKKFKTNDKSVRIHKDDENLMQMIYQIISAYFEDDCADELTFDPVFNAILEKDSLASQPTLSRFFNRMDEDTLMQFDDIDRSLRDIIYSIKCPEHMLLDLDSTLFGTYGRQEGEGFNFHYRAHGYHPLLCYDGLTGDLLKAELRDGTLHCSNGAGKFMESLLQEYIERGIKTYLRGDSGFSTLRYYDEIGLLKPTKLTESGYRLYDNKALEQLQEIMFFRELEIPLMDIKKIMENPNYDKEQVLLAQKSFLERKRNRLNGIIELITDVMKGVNTMSFEAFNNDDIQKMLDHTLETMSKEALDEQVAKYGSKEKYREYLASGFANEQAMADLVKWYGSKEKAMEAILQSTGKADESKPEQDENDKIYKQFMSAKKENNDQLAKEAVVMLAENYKKLFHLDNARNILLDLAKEYLAHEKLAEAADKQYGAGCAEYIGKTIQMYYGI